MPQKILRAIKNGLKGRRRRLGARKMIFDASKNSPSREKWLERLEKACTGAKNDF
jgi:hypothetical protein